MAFRVEQAGAREGRGAEIMSQDTESSIIESTCSDSACKGKGTYLVPLYCLNCGWKGRIRWTKSHHSFTIFNNCPSCECSTLKRDDSRKVEV